MDTAASPATSPHHSPTGPAPAEKPSQMLMGKPISQKPTSPVIIGVRVSPRPRKMPIATTWSPSKT